MGQEGSQGSVAALNPKDVSSPEVVTMSENAVADVISGENDIKPASKEESPAIETVVDSVPEQVVKIGSGENEVRIVTWNVLSPIIATLDNYSLLDPDHVDGERRYERIIEYLKEEVALKSIICLQEISGNWLGRLHTFFRSKNYILVANCYGGSKSKDNGQGWNLGVGIAYPVSHFDIIECEIIQVGKLWNTFLDRPQPRESEAKTYKQLFKDITKSKINTVKKWVEQTVLCCGCGDGPKPESFDPYKNARSRENPMICIKFRGWHCGTFTVGTYHMPCLFGSAQKEKAVNCHLILARLFLTEFSGGSPFFFLGDFNIKPTSPPYAYCIGSDKALDKPVFKEESWPKDLFRQKRFKEFCANLARTPIKLTSAYLEKHGEEPNFTNIGANGGNRLGESGKEKPDIFIDTLDYIFYTAQRGVKVLDMDVLRHRDTLAKPTDAKKLGEVYPNVAMPSDHVPLAGRFEIPKQEDDGWSYNFDVPLAGTF